MAYYGVMKVIDNGRRIPLSIWKHPYKIRFSSDNEALIGIFCNTANSNCFAMNMENICGRGFHPDAWNLLGVYSLPIDKLTECSDGHRVHISEIRDLIVD